MRRIHLLIAAMVPLILTMPSVALADAAAPNDPAEGFNRQMFAVNEKLKVVERPIANVYNKHVPSDVRAGVHNLLHNVNDEPVTLGNDLLQGNFTGFARTSARIVVNSIFGMGGIGDVAKNMGLPSEDSSFDATLCHYGAGQGPYLVIPVLGSSSVRGAVGTAVDSFGKPLVYAHWRGKTPLDTGIYVATAVDGVSQIGQLDDIERTSVDPYAMMRSIYKQRHDCTGHAAPADL